MFKEYYIPSFDGTLPQIYVNRTIYEARCRCGNFTEIVPEYMAFPKERVCQSCKSWMEYKAISYFGPELNYKQLKIEASVV